MSLSIGRQDFLLSLRRLAGFRGSTNFDLGETFMPTFDMVNPEPPFHTKIGGAASFARAAGGAGTFAGVFLGFRAGAEPTAVIVVRKLFIATPGAVTPRPVLIAVGTEVGFAAVVRTAQTTAGTWDSISPAPTTNDVVRTVGQISEATPGAAFIAQANGLRHYSAPVGAAVAPVPLEAAWVVKPGNLLAIMAETANEALNVGFYWDEYYLG